MKSTEADAKRLLVSIRDNWLEIVVVVFLLLVSLVVQLQGSNLGLWQDEAYTIKEYVEKGPVEIMTGDSYRPNNHILYSLFIWVISSGFGFSEIAVRLPSILASLGAFIVVYLIGRKYMGKSVAVFSLSMLTLGYFHVSSTSTARGYGFLLLFGALFTYFILNYLNHAKGSTKQAASKRKKNLLLSVLFGFMAVYTFPSFAAVIVCTYSTLIVISKSKRKELFAAVLIGGGLVALAFAPLASDFIKYYVGFGGGFSRHVGIGWESIFTLPVDKIYGILSPTIEPLTVRLDSVTGKLNIEATLLFGIATILALGAITLYKRDKRLAALLVIPPTIFTVLGILFSIPLGVRSDYTVFLEFNYVLLFSIGAIVLLRFAYAFSLGKNGIVRALLISTMAIVAMGLVVLIIDDKKDQIVNRNVPLEAAKESMEFARDEYKDIDYKLVIYGGYAGGTSYTFYADKVLDKKNTLITLSKNELNRFLEKNRNSNIILVDHVYGKPPVNTLLRNLSVPNEFDQRVRGYTSVYLIKPQSLSR